MPPTPATPTKPRAAPTPSTKLTAARAMRRKQWAIGSLATLVVLLAMLIGVLGPADRLSEDWRAANFDASSPGPSNQIALAAIDDRAVETIGRWPWPRETLASIIDQLRELGASVIAMDILLDDPSTPESDLALREAIRRHGDVIVPTNFRFATEDSRETILAERATAAVAERPDLLTLPPGPARTEAVRNLAEQLARSIVGGKKTSADAVPSAPSNTGTPELDENELYRQTIKATAALDQALSMRAMRLASASGNTNRLDPLRMPKATEVSPPIWPLASVAKMTANVTVNSYDADAKIRRIPVAINWQDDLWPTLGIAAAIRQAHKLAPDLRNLGDGVMGVPRASANRAGKASDELTALQTHRASFSKGTLPGLAYITWPRGTPSIADRARPRMSVDWQWQFYDTALAQTAEISMAALADRQRLTGAITSNSATAAEAARRAYGHPDRKQLPDEALAALDKALRAGDEAAATPLLAQAAGEAKVFVELLTDGTTLDKLKPEDRAIAQDLIAAERELPRLLKAITVQRAQLAELNKFLKSHIEGRIVFMGLTATGTNADFVATPISPKTPGVHVHMAMANMVLQNHQRVYGPLWLDALAAIGLGLLGTLLAQRLSVLGAPVLTLASVGAWAAVAGMALWDHQRLIVAVAGPGIAGFGACGAVLLHRLAVEQRTRRKTEERFKSYVSPKVVDILVSNPGLDSMKPQRRELSILFTDIAGFTTIAERLGSDRTAEVLRKYLGPMTETLQTHDGTLDKYIGDAIVAFWGAPIENPRHAEQACAAALDMIRTLDKLNGSGAFGEGVELSMRVGIATGDVMVGDFGNPPRNSSYTVLGDTANLASRLEGANKAFASRILVNNATKLEASRATDPAVANWLWRPIGKVAVKGKTEAVEMWELIGDLKPKGEHTAEYVRTCTDLVTTFTTGDTAGARTLLAAYEQRWGGDAFCKTYREAIELIERGEAKPGVLTLLEK